MIYPARCQVCGGDVADPNLYRLPEHQLGFLLGTRCASTSIKRAILESVGEDSSAPHDSQWLLDRHTDMRPEFRTFAIVRHPFARLVSTWRFLVQQNYWPHMKCYGIREGVGFVEFCEAVTRVNPLSGDLHLRPLAPLVGAYADEVLHYESLASEWPRVAFLSAVRLPELMRSNESETGTPEGLENGLKIAERYYSGDFSAFGYAPDDQSWI